MCAHPRVRDRLSTKVDPTRIEDYIQPQAADACYSLPDQDMSKIHHLGQESELQLDLSASTQIHIPLIS